MNLGSMFRLAKGAVSQDELAELLAVMGIDAEFASVSQADALAAFQGAGEAASVPGSTLVRLRARMKGGEQLTGILVVNRSENPQGPLALSA